MPDRGELQAARSRRRQRERRELTLFIRRLGVVLALLVAITVAGTVGFSRFLEDRRRSGRDLCFVIGGPFGLDLDRVDRHF